METKEDRMNIEQDELWLCSDCTYVACNGESGGVFADIEATRKGLADLQTDGRHLAPNFDSNPDDKDDFSETHNIDMAYARACNGTCADCGMTPDECTEKRCPYHESGIREFSSTQCAACKTNLAGYRARFCTLTDRLFNEYGHYLGPKFPEECVTDCTHQGDCYEDVKAWRKRLNFNVPRDRATDYLREYGAWSKEELDAMDEEELAIKVLWIACGDIKESGDWYGLCH